MDFDEFWWSSVIFDRFSMIFMNVDEFWWIFNWFQWKTSKNPQISEKNLKNHQKHIKSFQKPSKNNQKDWFMRNTHSKCGKTPQKLSKTIQNAKKIIKTDKNNQKAINNFNLMRFNEFWWVSMFLFDEILTKTLKDILHGRNSSHSNHFIEQKG